MTRPHDDGTPLTPRMPTTASALRSIAFVCITLASVGVGLYALVAYTTRPIGSTVHPQMQTVFESHRLGILTHIFASSLATFLGPLQFVPALRRRWPIAHRWTGRIYLGAGVLVGGLASLYMSFFAFGGLISTIGFATLAVIWIYTGIRAYSSARAKDFKAHRAWMIRNFALTLAAVTIRIGIGIGFAIGLPFETFYPILTWLCWVPNLFIAQWLIMRT